MIKILKYKIIMNFEKFLKSFPKDKTYSIDQSLVNKYKDILPWVLLDFWKQNWLWTYWNWLIQFINPDDYIEVLNKWLLRENDFTRIPFLISAFWEIYYLRILKVEPFEDIDWDIKDVVYDVSYMEPHYSSTGLCVYKMEDFFDTIAKEDYIELLKRRSIENDRQFLFDWAIEKLGKLEPEQIYYFLPALRIWWFESVENIWKWDTRVQLEILLLQLAFWDENETSQDII